MRGKNENGEFHAAPFSPLKWGDAFTEGNGTIHGCIPRSSGD